MQNKIALAALVLGVFVTPALAQTSPRTQHREVALAGEQNSRADCIAQFRAIDRNGNGVLSTAEVERGSRYMPTDIGDRGPINMTQFMDSCVANIERGG